MTKELEAFENIVKVYGDTNSLEGTYNDFLTIKKALQRLEAIDNSEPSEALKIVETLADDGLLNKEIGAISYNQIWLKNQIEILKQALLKSQEQEKVLEIIKEKKVNIDLLYASSSVEQYNDELVRVYGMWFVKDRQLTQDEFDTLKEVVR